MGKGKNDLNLWKRNDMNSEDIFRLALNITDPWFIKEIKLEKSSEKHFGKLSIEIDFKRSGTFLFSDGKDYKAYDTEVRTWKHMNFFEHGCFLTARLPRIMDSENKAKTVTVPWARSGSGFTLLYEAFAMLLIEQEMPVSRVSQILRETPPRIWRIFNHWISKAVSKNDVSRVRQVGIDETSSRKVHNYVTMVIRFLRNQVFGFQKPGIIRLLMQCLILSVVLTSCESDQNESNWVDGDSLTISQYLEKNKGEYSKFYRLLTEGKMLGTLYAYNPYGEDYTLFLPTDEAIDHYIEQNQKYGNFEELVKDTGFVKILTRYHTINRKIRSDEFPDGALNDLTLTGDRLVTCFNSDGKNQIIKVNNVASIVKSNLKMTNGYIHVISEVLQQVNITGYDWLQQQNDYSILAQAMKLSGIKSKLWWSKYTILAEHDSIYRKKGINKIEDLIARIASPGLSLSDKANSFYLFTAYHLIGGEFYLNDFKWGSEKYTTLASKPLTIAVGYEIMINPGVDTYRIKITESGDTTVIDYIRPIWQNCNIMTRTGPVHSISDVMYFNPMP